MREAQRAFEAALDIQRNALCHEPFSVPLLFSTATSLLNLAYLYNCRGLYATATIVLKEAASFQAKGIGKCHTALLSTLGSLADCYAKCGEYSASLTCFEDIISRLEKSDLSSNFRRTCLTTQKKRSLAIIHYKMSRIYQKQNDYDAARRKLKVSSTFISELGDPDLLTRVQKEIVHVENTMKWNELNWL